MTTAEASALPSLGTHPGAHVLLVGMMGTGKSTVGALLGERLGRPHVDTDAVVERHCGLEVAAIFARRGEAAFRAEERRALAEVLASPTPAVISVGGGAVLDATNRRLLAAAGQVVWLRARPVTLARRLGDGAGRPLLAEDPEGALARLEQERRPLYAALAGECAVEVDERAPLSVAAAVIDCLRRRIPVALGDRSYEVVVGPGVSDELAGTVPPGARRAVVVTQSGIPLTLDSGVPTSRVEIGLGERAKNLQTVEACCRAFVAAGLTRADLVIGLGGGMVTDVAGFAASVHHRGTPVVQVATTLLAQVDAAIGGKTGVNLPEGKNLVGSFWQPRAVLCDTDALTSLPEREWRSGLGEMAKYAFLGVDDLDRLPLVDQVARCVEAKAVTVAADEREGSARLALNYGHTLAHALEALDLSAADAAGHARPPVDLRHGEAVAIGLIFAARLAEGLGRIGEDRVGRHLEVVRAYGLPEAIPGGVSARQLLALMARDKKATAGPTFVLDGPAGVEPVRDVPVEKVLEALVACGASGADS